MKEFIEKGIIVEAMKSVTEDTTCPLHISATIDQCIDCAPIADVIEIPQEYSYHTDMDDENYLVCISVPITKKQFDAISNGKDLWNTLRNKE